MNRICHLLEYKGHQVETIDASASVAEAVARMNARHIGSIVVTRGDVLAGILTERDVLTRIVANGHDPRAVEVCEVMTTELVTVELETPIAMAMRLVTERRCRHLPVVDGHRLLGLVSGGDLTAWLLRDQERTIYDLHDFITH
ncbi:MAG: CBS domain-containing protein [Deltaproteobacteria bacterium]|nr:CBS domain-containing protein [Deltaproteobacteria bacterium]